MFDDDNFVILINSTKTLNFNNKNCNGLRNFTQPTFAHKSGFLRKEISAWTLDDFSKNMKISTKLSQLTYSYFHDDSQNYCRAFFAYSGLFFKQLELDKFDMEWVNKHVLILDPLYGLLKSTDIIHPYRLDFYTQNLSVNLYDFWNDEIYKFLKDKKIYSLASNEFTKLLQGLNYIDISPTTSKQIKIARGQLLNKIIINKKIISQDKN
ncbi:hypothetical protein EI74_0512 [Mycoplasma testudineum]|uniref:YaaA family protein n=1 Tax=Mycoplasma testudineum TaxID=244584 RepID=A0A4R6ICA0_9MOLU|nr:peroxide stress protein YaaA [Mycoplasma testudineum]OYD26737.1 hypothetical protein CG473_02165 [Mycoplasma testudineum]TDO19873.1 hypothetical protein EI74_0512 [Mycoplasma testudineum]